VTLAPYIATGCGRRLGRRVIRRRWGLAGESCASIEQ